jgi:ABC-type uncharacterized transport system substrate-binding protein
MQFSIRIAEMVAAQIFNASKNRAIPVVYGSVTSGRAWQFLKLEGKNVTTESDSSISIIILAL